MNRPLIAVSTAIEKIPTAFGDQDCTKLTVAYSDALYRAGAQPVILPVTSPPPAGLMDAMDGLVLTGGGDIDAAFYGEEPDPTVYGVRPDRDAFEAELYRGAVERGVPILAICRGMQLINVIRGGTLIQEIQDEQDHWQENPADHASHDIDVVASSRLATAVGTDHARVNSYHHQAIDKLGAGLQVTATCGVILEAVEATDVELIAVQWHPEQMASTDRQQQRLFDTFVKKAAASRVQPDSKEALLCLTT